MLNVRLKKLPFSDSSLCRRIFIFCVQWTSYVYNEEININILRDFPPSFLLAIALLKKENALQQLRQNGGGGIPSIWTPSNVGAIFK